MTDTAQDAAPNLQEKLRAVFHDRSVAAMLLLGIGAGLPYAVLTGTLNAWFTEADVDVSTIGVLSWIGLAYAFKFLWSPSLQRSRAPRGVLRRMGNRRGWMLAFQVLVALAIALIAAADPADHLGLIALAAVLGVAAAASGDIVIDAWRIEVARNGEHLDTLSSVYQFGFRLASILGGAVALLIAARAGWNFTFLLLALAMALPVWGTLLAREPDRRALEPDAGPTPSWNTGLSLRARNVALGGVLLLWGWAVVMLTSFMTRTVLASDPPDAGVFMRRWGPWIVAATILAPAVVSALLLRLRAPYDAPGPIPPAMPGRGQSALDTLFSAILEPLMDLIARIGWGAPLVLVLILSYRFADLVWGAFAYPFYLGTHHGALGHSLDEVALASKIIGALVTVVGIALGGLAMKAFGRMTCLIAGAALAAATNLLFYDLALGAPVLGGVLGASGGYAAFAAAGIDAPLANLITAIAGENLAVGFATVVFVAYLSSIVNPRYAAVQYALLASLTMLIGTLGRGALGQLIETEGFGYVFLLTALLGLVAVAASAGEAARTAWRDRAVSRGSS